MSEPFKVNVVTGVIHISVILLAVSLFNPKFNNCHSRIMLLV